MTRKKYDNILNWKDKSRKPLIINGARQVGKTHLVKLFGQSEFKKYHYFNFEENQELHQVFIHNLNANKIIHDLELLSGTAIDKSELIIFDEIQACPRALTSLKYFKEADTYKIISAGSLLGIHLNDESFPVGQVDFIDLHPLNFSEFLEVTNNFLFQKYQAAQLSELIGLLHDKLVEAYINYLFVGGMPEAVYFFASTNEKNLKHLMEVRTIQNNILKSYHADFAKHSGKVNSMSLSNTWKNCALQIGQVHDDSVKRFKFQNVLPGKKQYSQFENIFNWLEKASLIIKTHIIDKPEIPLLAYTKNSLFKAYVFDTGILNAILEIPAHAIFNQSLQTFKGFMAENFVAEELASYGLKSLFCWEGKSSEVEFVIELNGLHFPLEVKSGTITRSKSLQVYAEKYQPEKKFICSLKPYSENGNLFKIPLYALEKILHHNLIL
jgi:predicted AAA+ superfamily ATPase